MNIIKIAAGFYGLTRLWGRTNSELKCWPLLSPSETSRTSGWTFWDTRGRSWARPSSSEPIWRRGRWRCEVHLQHTPVPRISVVFTFLCLLCPVTFISVEHNLSQNKKRISFRLREKNRAPLCVFFYTSTDTTARRREKKKRSGLPAGHSR